MSTDVVLPRSDGTLHRRVLRTGTAPAGGPQPLRRRAYAAAHVVADPVRSGGGSAAALDWDATILARQRIWRAGLGVADAMDTAQRGMGLDWPVVRDLIAASAEASRESGGRLVVGVATDQLPPNETRASAVLDAYLEQLAVARENDCRTVLMASRHLAAGARSPSDYLDVYGRLIDEAGTPVILHWLGEAFDPALRGYWGSPDPDDASKTVLELIDRYGDRIDGIKLSLLDADREVALRRRLPSGVRMYTGDDFHYADLIADDDVGHSDALLGAFAAFPEIAADALRRLDVDDAAGCRDRLEATQELSRKIFEAPTYYYKTGIVWLAYIGGHQRHFRMVGGSESGRSLTHLAELVVLADDLGLLPDAELAADRVNALMSLHGIG